MISGSETSHFFVNGFCVSSSLCAMMISASAVELGFEDYFWDKQGLIFCQRFLSQQKSMCAEYVIGNRRTGFLMVFRSQRTSFHQWFLSQQ
jgi:hypothetical protein